MKLKKRFKILPILNKTLKELYSNDIFELTETTKVLKEENELDPAISILSLVL